MRKKWFLAAILSVVVFCFVVSVVWWLYEDEALREESIKSLFRVVVFGITAWITVRLALRRFYTQKWWERKAQAYSEIIGSLAKMQFWFDKWKDERRRYEKIGFEEKKKDDEEYASAKRVIVNAEAQGSFIISEEAAQVLGSFLKELQKKDIQGNWPNDFDRYYDKVIECIKKLRDIAKRDLNIKII